MTDSVPDESSISARQVAGALLGGALVGYAPAQRGRSKTFSRLAGAGLVVAALVPALSRGLIRAGAARRRVSLRMTLVVERAVREVFAFCHNFENFPLIVPALRCVTDYQDGRSRWEVLSPSGEVLAWDAVVTKYVPNVVIAWRAVAGSVVDCSGLIRFAPVAAEKTRLDVQVEYDPCHTGLADALRALIATRGQNRLEHALARIDDQFPAPIPGALDGESEEAAVEQPESVTA